jgi:hypothetical protein
MGLGRLALDLWMVGVALSLACIVPRPMGWLLIAWMW